MAIAEPRKPKALPPTPTVVEGVELFLISRNIPVLSLDKLSCFHENASWMLQSAMLSQVKADMLYEHFDSREIKEECLGRGYGPEEVGLVRLREKNHVMAIGIAGKRAVMLSLVVALALSGDSNLQELWMELNTYKLSRAFDCVLQFARSMIRHVAPPPQLAVPAPAPAETGVQGVDLHIVCQIIPVVCLDKDSIFHENASMLLQTVMSSSSKADSLFEYCTDRTVMNECRRLGLTEQDIFVARLKREDLRHVTAVGSSGKRSVMLALVVAMLMCDNCPLDTALREVADFDPELELLLVGLIELAVTQCENCFDEMDRANVANVANMVQQEPRDAWGGKRKPVEYERKPVEYERKPADYERTLYDSGGPMSGYRGKGFTASNWPSQKRSAGMMMS